MNSIIVIPYRDRAAHLSKFLSNATIPTLIVEQNNDKPFNRGKLFNIGGIICFQEGASHIITHDVDMIPIKVDYSPSECAHLASRCSQFNYKMPYERYFGGVNIYSAKTFYMVNGYSNDFWGWGAEDDDMLLRCEKANIQIERRLCKFNSLPHVHALSNNETRLNHQKNCVRMNTGYDYSEDGINNCEYTVLSDTGWLNNIRTVTVAL